MHFKRLLTRTLFLLAGSIIGCKHTSSLSEQSRPNLLFILVDDQRNDILGCAGNPIVQTPTVDKLAEKGKRFTNAFVTTSICAASRASILTGLYECTHQYTFGQPPLKRDYLEKSYPFLLKQAGYRTGFVGKLGVEMEERDTMLKEMFDYCRLSTHNTPYFDTLPDGRRLHSSEIKGQQAIEFIRQQSPGQPFCLSISFNAVHAVDNNLTPGKAGHYPYPDAMDQLYEGVTMPKPVLSSPEIFEQHPDFLKKSMNRIRYFWRWDTDATYQTNMQAYFRMISGYDWVIKQVLEVLQEQGLDNNTIVVFAADNGYYMGERGFAGKWSHYEESLRVPLIIYDPRTPSGSTNATDDRIVLNIDIPSTLLSYAGVTIPGMYQGQSLAPLMGGEVTSWRDGFFCEHRMNHPDIPKWRGYRGSRYVYANYYEQNPPYEYLHDLQRDPQELRNLASHSDYQSLLEEMRTLSNREEEELTGYH